jgi:LTXXQ motif family protein
VKSTLLKERRENMNRSRFFTYFILAVFLLGSVIGCKPRIDTMAKAEKIFIKKVDQTAKKLDLNEDQRVKLESLKAEIRKNFQEGGKEKKEALAKIKEEGVKENPDIPKMTSLLQGMLRNEAGRLNKGFDLLQGFQSNLTDVQKKKLAEMISKYVKKWD